MFALDPSQLEDLKKREFYQAESTVLDASTDLLNWYASLARGLSQLLKKRT